MLQSRSYSRCFCAFLLLLCGSVRGFSEDSIKVKSLGLDGHFVVGRTALVTAEISGDEAGDYTVQVVAPDPQGNLVRFHSATVNITAGENQTVSTEFQVGQLDSTVELKLLRAGKVVAFERLDFSKGDGLLSPGVKIVGTIGKPWGLNREPSDEQLILDLDREQLPVNARTMSAMRVLVISSDYGLSEIQVACIREWVQYGGHLIVSVANNVDSYLASPLGRLVQDWIPIESEVSQLTELPGVEGFVDNSAPIPLGRRRIVATRILDTDGETLAMGSDGPLIEQVAVGFGRVTLVGVDLDSGPLTKWKALPVMMNRLVFDQRRSRKESDAGGSSIGHNGVTDLATQLHASQASFPEISRPSSWIAMGLILFYLLVIGPLDYFIVHRLLKRPRLTWVTFPTMVILGCIAGVSLARQANGDVLRLNQTSIVDIDAGDSQACRLQSWISVYSPDSRRAAVTAAPASNLAQALGAQTVEPSLLMWNGIPENVFGGMLRSGGASLGNVKYEIRPDAIAGLPIPIWSTRSVRTNWRTSAEPQVKSRLATTTVGLLRGSLTHTLPFPIKNWIVAHGLRVYQPRGTGPNDIRAGQPWSPQSPKVQRRDLESFLTGVQTIQVKQKLGEGGSDLIQKRAVYDSLELDASYAIRMLSLHEAAGGKSYTGLTNTLLSELDFSRLIRLNRAVLIGEIETPASTISLDGTKVDPTRSRTFVRIVLPVEQQTGSR